ncbi:MAG: O-antigen ligase family protein [Bacteroidetes bacterium]|nr:O-antigen ligase family protein [Bacteroidota bacterium]
MMIGTVPTSVPQFILLGNWLLEADFKRKWTELRSNKLFWILSSVFLMHVAGLLYTSDLAAGIDDVRIKLPLLFLPLVFFTTKPLSRNEFHFLLYCFLLGSFINITWCYIYSFVLHKNEIARSASRFMSHIRLGLYLNVAIAACVYFIFVHAAWSKKIFFICLMICFLFSMYVLGLASGFADFFILIFLAVLYLIFKQNLKFKAILIFVLITGIYIVGKYVNKVYESQVLVNNSSYNSVKERSANGRLYSQLDLHGQKENGNYVFINIQFDELHQQWNRRCPEDSFAYKPAYNLKRYEVLLRYLSGKALTKDSAGVCQLTAEDVNNIKNNIQNHETSTWSYLHKRVYEIVYEYEEFKNKRNVNGHSLTMRPYFWKAAILNIKSHPLAGVGTGDVQAEMNKTYIAIHSPLQKNWFKRPHNQFLTIAVALGIGGLLVFILSLVAPLIQLNGKLHVLFYAFFILAIISFLLEDTLESQAGATFFAFFNTLFIAQAYYRWKEDK